MTPAEAGNVISLAESEQQKRFADSTLSASEDLSAINVGRCKTSARRDQMRRCQRQEIKNLKFKQSLSGISQTFE